MIFTKLRNKMCNVGARRRGFTMIEIMVTISVIGILASIVTISIAGSLKSARDYQRSSRIAVISESLEKYYLQNGEYPACAELTAEPDTVSSNVLKGISIDALAVPGAGRGANSITCLPAAVNTYQYDSDGTKYTLFYVKEVDNQIASVKSRYSQALLPGTLVSYDGLGNTQVNLKWTAVKEAGNYRIQRATDSAFTTGLSDVFSNDLSMLNSELATGTTYYFRVMAKAMNASSEWSDPVTAVTTTVSPPTSGAPIVAVNTVGSTTTWSWNAATCGPGTTARYQYRYTIDSGYDSTWSIPTVPTATSISMLTQNEGYAYTMAVKSQCYTSMASSTFSDPGSADYTRPMTASTAPVVAVSYSNPNVVATITPIICGTGMAAQYGIRSRTNDGTWSAYGAWSASTTASQAASQGSKYGYQAQSRCQNAVNTTATATGLESTYIHPISTPGATVVGVSTSGATTTWTWGAVSCAAGTTNYQYRYTITGGYDSGWVNPTVPTDTSVAFTTSTPTGATFTVQVRALCVGSYTTSATGAVGQNSYFRPNIYTLTVLKSGLGSYTNCAAENGTCSAPGVTNVRYGAYDKWYTKTSVSGSIACTNANFGGDPIPNYVKSCQYQVIPSVSGGGTYTGGTAHSITATPSGDFNSWTGAGCGSSATSNVTVNSNMTCTANFSSKTVDSPAPPAAPSAPSISSAFVSNQDVLTINAVTCTTGTPEYRYRFARRKLSSDSSWVVSWTSWSTSRTASQTGLQGNSHTYEVIAHCNLGGTYSLDSGTSSTNLIMDIGQPPAPAYAGPASFNHNVHYNVNFVSYCPTGTDAINGTFTSNLSSTGNIWGPHPWGFSDYWTNLEGRTLIASYWGTYQCQTSWKASPLSPSSGTQVNVYSG